MVARKSTLRMSTALPLLVALLAATASAADADAAQRQAYYNIPRGDADSALMAFAQTSGLRFLAPSHELAGVRTRPVSGRHTPREALQLLLTGTGLTATYGEDGTFTVRRADASDAPANPRVGSALGGAGVDPATQRAQPTP